ncbi:MAG TPA: cyclic nucleotide-binding domain-containing protein, partial [Myxococcales bacterium]|nr:cyclic nucleotide-binding domain-containing protein [Myxococcales bacterium]
MAHIARSEVVVPGELSREEREKLIDALYKVQREVFDGVDRKAFAKYVVLSQAERTSILVHKNKAGAIVGYFAVHVFERELNGEPVAIFRAEAGTMREYRGCNSNTWFGLWQGLRSVLANPKRRIYYLGSLVHPSSYSLFAKYFPVVFPSAGVETPAEAVALMNEMAEEFGLEQVDAENPLIRKVGWKTRDTEAERAYWKRCDRPAARFFVETNKGYSQGHGLLTLVPVSLAAMACMARQMIGQKLARIRDAFLARWPRPGEVLRQLQSAPLLAGIASSTLHALASASQLEVKPAGSVLFRQGEAGEDVLMLARGAAYVLVDQDGQEHIIDEIGSGALAGEMGALSGEPRTATVRTASSSMLVRMPRRALLVAMETDQVLRARLWRLYCERRLDAHVRVHPHFRHLEHDRRRDWLRQGSEHRMSSCA